MREVPSLILERARHPEPVFTSDEVGQWPSALLDRLVKDGILVPTSNARSVVCDACGDEHVEMVQFVESPPGSELRAYIPCPENGRVRVPLDRLRCWRVNLDTVPRSADASGLGFTLPENVTMRSVSSTEFLPTPSPRDAKELRQAAKYCRQQAARCGDARAQWWLTQAHIYDVEAEKAESQDLRLAAPHALSVSHSAAVQALRPAEDLYRRTGRFPNPAPVIDAIERFVHELELVPAWRVELQRRSSLVELSCANGSQYEVAREQAMSSHSKVPQTLSAAKLALEGLRNPNTQNPQLLLEVVEIRNNIESLLRDATAGMSNMATSAFQTWRHKCRTIQLEAERLHVDGCWFLDHIYQSAGLDPSERSQVARAILETNMGGAHLEELHLAIDSMFAWASENRSDEATQQDEPSSEQVMLVENSAVLPRVWPVPEEHTTGKIWTRKDGVLCLSTKTDGSHDGQVEFAPNASGELTYQMRLMQVLVLKFPGTVTLAQVIQQVYPDDYAEARRDPAMLTKTFRKLRSLVSDIRNKKFAKAGLNPDILPPLSVEASIDAGIGLQLAKLHRLDDKELDKADMPPDQG